MNVAVRSLTLAALYGAPTTLRCRVSQCLNPGGSREGEPCIQRFGVAVIDPGKMQAKTGNRILRLPANHISLLKMISV